MGRQKSQTVIGIVPSYDEGNNIPAGGDVGRVYLRHEYTANIAEVGAIPLILNSDMPHEMIMQWCDGIVISGGEDIEPELYGQEALPSTRFNEPVVRFEWEKHLITESDKINTPILGICYGLQRLNIHYGGTLVQDIDSAMPDNIGHDKTVHEIEFSGEFLSMSGRALIASRHHQAIDKLADGFEVRATAPDGIIEAIEGFGHFGMQWHPESDKTGQHVYRAFVEHCAKRMKKS